MKAAKAEAILNEGLAFLESNKNKPGVIVLPSGLQYEIITEGSGAKPTATQTVPCHYHGTLTNGTVFDSSVKRGAPASFPLNRVISGWTEALQLMPVGSKWRLFLPPQLAYGSMQVGSIPANSTLIFEVELLGIA
jgi:FKBP-type peptidyl-prolyl cis-trans isomerase FklB